MLRGAEQLQSFSSTLNDCDPTGKPIQIRSGDVEAVSPQVGDVHQVSNIFEDEMSISIHVYGANIGAVQWTTWQLDGSEKRFIYGYSNAVLIK